MTTATSLPELALRSHDATWDRARWDLLPADGNRYAVIDGVLYMTTVPSAFHQWIVRQIFVVLYQQIDTTGIGFTFFAPIGLCMPYCDPVQPDLVVVRAAERGMIHDRRINGVPALIVEVLSPTNPTQDTAVKRSAYARAGVPEYWIVRPASRDVLLCTHPDQTLGDYVHSQLYGASDSLSSPTLPIHTAVSSFFAGAPDTTL